MKKTLGLVLVLSLLVPLGLQGQERSAELQQLDELVGAWTFVYQGSDGIWECEWFGDSFVQCAAEVGTSSEDGLATVDMFAYNAREGVYSWDRFVTNGIPEAAKGWFQNDTWTFVFDEPAGSKRRASLLVETPDVLTLRWEDSVEGGDWEMRSEIRMTKVR